MAFDSAEFTLAGYQECRDLLGRAPWAYGEESLRGAVLEEALLEPSPFAFLFKGKGYHALYHSLTLRKLYGDRQLAACLSPPHRPRMLGEYLTLLRSAESSDPFGTAGLLIENGFLVPAGGRESDLLAAWRHNPRFLSPAISLMYLLSTNDCNLRCRYCSVESKQRKPTSFPFSFMDPATARAGIDLFAGLLPAGVLEPKVIYYGGEPFLNRETFLASLAYIRERERQGAFQDRPVEVSIVSNGTLIDEDLARELKRFSVNVSVSLDGMARHHDAMRVYRDGRGSWEDAVRGYRLIVKHLGRCGISCTLGPHNYRDAEEIAEYFATRLECRGLGFNILKGLPPGNDLEVPASEVTEEIIRAFKVLRRFGIYEDRIMRKVKSFVNEEPWVHDCGGYGGQIALCADGFLGPCQIAADDHRFLWGHVSEKDIGSRILHGELTGCWARRTPLLMEQCRDCVGLGICGGGCADEAAVKHGDIYALDEAFCSHCKTLIAWMMDDLAAQLFPRREAQGVHLPVRKASLTGSAGHCPSCG
ncbi:MAG: radical SAM protein [Candidatus Eremiobacteraeota bacterium]|nr:radical SAM protein [Candidatus Eremiobacteraeota bacterium]